MPIEVGALERFQNGLALFLVDGSIFSRKDHVLVPVSCLKAGKEYHTTMVREAPLLQPAIEDSGQEDHHIPRPILCIKLELMQSRPGGED